MVPQATSFSPDAPLHPDLAPEAHGGAQAQPRAVRRAFARCRRHSFPIRTRICRDATCHEISLPMGGGARRTSLPAVQLLLDASITGSGERRAAELAVRLLASRADTFWYEDEWAPGTDLPRVFRTALIAYPMPPLACLSSR